MRDFKGLEGLLVRVEKMDWKTWLQAWRQIRRWLLLSRSKAVESKVRLWQGEWRRADTRNIEGLS